MYEAGVLKVFAALMAKYKLTKYRTETILRQFKNKLLKLYLSLFYIISVFRYSILYHEIKVKIFGYPQFSCWIGWDLD